MRTRALQSIVLTLSIAAAAACTEKLTPTEVPAYVAPVSQPASMSGKVTIDGGGGLAGALVVCQGRSATTAADGTYDLAALMSGESEVNVFYTATDSYVFTVSLAPGPNTQNFFLYE